MIGPDCALRQAERGSRRLDAYHERRTRAVVGAQPGKLGNRRHELRHEARRICGRVRSRPGHKRHNLRQDGAVTGRAEERRRGGEAERRRGEDADVKRRGEEERMRGEGEEGVRQKLADAASSATEKWRHREGKGKKKEQQTTYGTPTTRPAAVPHTPPQLPPPTPPETQQPPPPMIPQ